MILNLKELNKNVQYFHFKLETLKHPLTLVTPNCFFGMTEQIARRKRKRSTILLERKRKGHLQSDQHWNCFKDNIRDTPERRGGAHMGLPEHIDTILN